jgi:hypothetical protein
MRATLTGETLQVLELVERLDELGCSAQVAASGGCWHVDVRSTLPPTAVVLRRVVLLIVREFPGSRTTSLLLEVDDRRYHLLRPAPGSDATSPPQAA